MGCWDVPTKKPEGIRATENAIETYFLDPIAALAGQPSEGYDPSSSAGGYLNPINAVGASMGATSTLMAAGWDLLNHGFDNWKDPLGGLAPEAGKK